jgi:hypothetical protein
MLNGNAHLIAGSEDSIPTLLGLLQKESIKTIGNPDLYIRTYKNFGIDDAHDIRARAALRPIGERRVFIVAASGMTSEAQNALLKTLEEPPANALFFLIVSSPHMLLPTLRSRMAILHLDLVVDSAAHIDAKKFLAASPSVRLEMLKPLIEKGDDDTRDIGRILTFLSSLESMMESAALNPLSRAGLKTVYRARRYMGDKGALVKPLLEQIALLAPRL